MTTSIELERNNVTPAKFFAEIRFACKKKGIAFDLDMDSFAKPCMRFNSSYVVKDGLKISHIDGYRYENSAEAAACQSEVCKALPYDHQTYMLTFEGYCFNEICEFTFDDEKTGHGYYYQMNKEAC